MWGCLGWGHINLGLVQNHKRARKLLFQIKFAAPGINQDLSHCEVRRSKEFSSKFYTSSKMKLYARKKPASFIFNTNFYFLRPILIKFLWNLQPPRRNSRPAHPHLKKTTPSDTHRHPSPLSPLTPPPPSLPPHTHSPYTTNTTTNLNKFVAALLPSLALEVSPAAPHWLTSAQFGRLIKSICKNDHNNFLFSLHSNNFTWEISTESSVFSWKMVGWKSERKIVGGSLANGNLNAGRYFFCLN